MAPPPAKPTSPEEIARRLILTRASFGLNQGEFAKRAGLSANTYNQYEMAKRVPALAEALKLCDSFGLTLDWIYRGEVAGLPFKLADDLRQRLLSPLPSPRKSKG